MISICLVSPDRYLFFFSPSDTIRDLFFPKYLQEGNVVVDYLYFLKRSVMILKLIRLFSGD